MPSDKQILQPDAAILDQLLTENEVARALKLTKSGLEKLRRRGAGPRFLRLGNGAVRYERRAIIDWLQSACTGPEKK